MRYQLPIPEGFAASLEGKELAELNTIQDELTHQRREVLARAQVVADRRKELMAEEDAASHGLTVEEYAAAKAAAKESGKTLHAVLREARKGAAKKRALQVAELKSAGAKVEAKKPK